MNLRSTNINDLIGAFELGDAPRYSDAALETASSYVAAGPTISCPPPPTIVICRRIDDAVLETASGYLAGQPTLGCPVPTTIICPRIDDVVV